MEDPRFALRHVLVIIFQKNNYNENVTLETTCKALAFPSFLGLTRPRFWGTARGAGVPDLEDWAVGQQDLRRSGKLLVHGIIAPTLIHKATNKPLWDTQLTPASLWQGWRSRHDALRVQNP